MRRIATWMASTVAIVVLLFLYRTSTSGPQAGTSTVATGPQAPGVVGGTAEPPSSAGPSKASGGSAGRTSSGVIKVNGSVAQTRWGPVQVKITVSGGKILLT